MHGESSSQVKKWKFPNFTTKTALCSLPNLGTAGVAYMELDREVERHKITKGFCIYAVGDCTNDFKIRVTDGPANIPVFVGDIDAANLGRSHDSTGCLADYQIPMSKEHSRTLDGRNEITLLLLDSQRMTAILTQRSPKFCAHKSQ